MSHRGRRHHRRRVNGLVAAAFLARAGRSRLSSSEASVSAGSADDRHRAGIPVFDARAPCGHRSAIVRALRLEQRGLQIVRPRALVCSPAADGRADVNGRPRPRPRESRPSPPSCRRFQEFGPVAAVSAVRACCPRASVHRHPAAADLPVTGNRPQVQGPQDRRLSTSPMVRCSGGLRAWWFESERCVRQSRPVASSDRSWACGRPCTAILLLLAASEGRPSPGWSVRGGIGRWQRSPTPPAGAALRSALVRRPAHRQGRAGRRRLAPGEGSGEALVSRTRIPAARSSGSSIAITSRVRSPHPEHPVQGASQINYAVTSLPAFGCRGRVAALSGCVRWVEPGRPGIRRGAYGQIADDRGWNWPSVDRRSRSRQRISMSSQHAAVCPTLDGTTWDAERERLGDVATRTIAKCAPGFERSVWGAESSPRPRAALWLDGWCIFHGESRSTRCSWRAAAQLGATSTPIRNLYLCGSRLIREPASQSVGLAGTKEILVGADRKIDRQRTPQSSQRSQSNISQALRLCAALCGHRRGR